MVCTGTQASTLPIDHDVVQLHALQAGTFFTGLESMVSLHEYRPDAPLPWASPMCFSCVLMAVPLRAAGHRFSTFHGAIWPGSHASRREYRPDAPLPWASPMCFSCVLMAAPLRPAGHRLFTFRAAIWPGSLASLHEYRPDTPLPWTSPMCFSCVLVAAPLRVAGHRLFALGGGELAGKHRVPMRVPAGRSLLWPILCSPCVTFCCSLAFAMPKHSLPTVLCRRGNLGFTKATACALLYTTAGGTCSRYVALNLFTNTMLCAKFWAPRSRYFTCSCTCK